MDPELFHWMVRLGGAVGVALCLWYMRHDRKSDLPTERWTQAALAVFLVAIAITFVY